MIPLRNPRPSWNFSTSDVTTPYLTVRLSIATPRADCGRGYTVLGCREQHALIEPADADHHSSKPDEGERAENAGQVCRVDEEYLADGKRNDCGRGEPRRLRSQREDQHQQYHSADAQRHRRTQTC